MLKNKNIRQFDFSGSKIGNWSVISISYTNDRGATYWKCVCVCGNEKDVLCYRLFHGKTKSCGCGVSFHGNRLLKSKEITKTESLRRVIRRLFTAYVFGAKNRSYIFELTEEQFKEFVLQDCYYCGRGPQRVAKLKSAIAYGIKTNGIDRKNNSAGYSIENCVSCCTDCNFLKGSLDHDSFLSMVKAICANRKKLTRKS